MSLRNRLSQTAKEPKEKPAPPPPADSATAPAPPPAARPEPARPRPAPAASGLGGDDYRRLKKWIVTKISAGLEPDISRTPTNVQMLRDRFNVLHSQANVALSSEGMESLFGEVCDDVIGYGPIEKLLGDPAVSEVMVNGPKQIYVERKGKLTLSDVTFEDDEHIMRVVERIVRPLGRRVDRKVPMVDARLPDGSRVNIIIPPAAIDGPTITIRKFATKRFTWQDLISFGSMTPQIAEFLKACVVSRLNIVVSGGTGSGKTTLLNVLSGFIPEDERVVTLEDSAELQLGQPHIVRLEARPPDPDGTGGVSIRDLVKNSLRMRPERIVVGEIRGGEAIDMLQAMNTGHDGSLTTLHANNPREAISRIETMSLMGGLEIPLKVIRESIAKAVDMIVQQTRLDDGSRKITYITEVSGMEGENVVMQDIFKYDETLGPDGKPGGMKPTGLRPLFTPRLESHGFKLPPEIFGGGVGAALGAMRGGGPRR
ncbi:MAG TPA: CpaF family protein [Anaerolineales bacterium]|nr:CpaF family protein [Anaerolineales bacterium]